MERTRPALRPLEAETPGEAYKRPRIGVMHTPAPSGPTGLPQMDTPMLLSTAAHDRPMGYSSELLELLRGRGGKIKELEEELARARQRSDALQSEVQAKQDQLSQLQVELVTARAIAKNRIELAGQLKQHELERLLDEELRKGVELEGQLAAAQEQRQLAEQVAADATAQLRSAQAEHARQIADMKVQMEAVHMRLKAQEMETDDRVRFHQAEAALERKHRETDQELHRTALRQLEELRAAKTAAPLAATAAVSANALTQRVQQLEEKLRATEAQLAKAAAHAASSPQAAARGMEPGATVGLPPVAHASAAHGSVALAAELVAMQAQLRAWQQGPLQQALVAAGSSTGNGASAEEAAAAVRRLAAQVRELRDGLATRDAQILEASARATGAEQRCHVLASEAAAAGSERQAAVAAEKAAVRQLAVITQERDALRRALAVPASTSKPNTISQQIEVRQQVARNEELQGLVVGLQEQLAALQKEAEAAAAGEAAQRVQAQAAQQRAEAAEARCAQLEKEADSLALDVASLQTKLGQGEVNRSSVRVLHFKLNPEAQYHRDKVDSAESELRAENTALKRRLEELAAEVDEARRKTAGTADGTSNATSEGVALTGSQLRELAAKEAEVAVVQHRLSEMEKSMVRLKEVTKERIVAFREACYCLFGYRVDMTSEATAARDAASATTTFSLKPQHADDPSLMLVFRYTKARGMELVPNAFSAKMTREVDTFIRKFQCIPAFTANLTIENFQKQTQC